jgi:quercetin dioxygenase-like cupin family protein
MELHRSRHRYNELVGEVQNQEQLKDLKVATRFDAVVEQVVAYGGVYMRQFRLKNKGDVHQGHRHSYNHITMLSQGSLMCEVDGFPTKVFTAPTPITIDANLWHRFTAMEPDTVYSCVFPVRDMEGKQSDIFTGDLSPYGHSSHTNEEILEKIKGGCETCGLSEKCITERAK